MIFRGTKIVNYISEELLLSLSMAHTKEVQSQQELAESLSKVLNPGLKAHFAELDRKLFQGNNRLPPQQLYGNFPIKLTKFDNMTTPIMHAIPSNIIYESAINENNSKILDVGTGRGYIPFLLKKAIPNSIVHGIDINQHLINQCVKIQQTLSLGEIKFYQHNILKQELQTDFDYINVGFAITENELQKLLQKTNQFIVCPLITDHKQYLMKINKDGSQTQIMSCLFQKGQIEERMQQSQQQFQEKKQVLENFIKQWHQQFFKDNKRVPTLEEMKKDQRVLEALNELEKVKRKIQ